jgi:glycosyltransferase involved in cell wall biosynthesis
MAARAILHYMRLWDRTAADRVDVFLANSHYVAARIRKTYRRPAHVLYPPVDVGRFTVSRHRDDFYLAASRMVPYKRLDLIVEAFRQLPRRKLVVIGDGPEYKKIARRLPPNVDLLGPQDDAALRQHLQTARAFIFAADEDFGIMPVEAQACGTPVIAFGRGGALETVIDGETGVFFPNQTAGDIAQAVERFESLPEPLDPYQARANAERFSIEIFREELARIIDREWTTFRNQAPRELASRGLASEWREPADISAFPDLASGGREPPVNSAPSLHATDTPRRPASAPTAG